MGIIRSRTYKSTVQYTNSTLHDLFIHKNKNNTQPGGRGGMGAYPPHSFLNIRIISYVHLYDESELELESDSESSLHLHATDAYSSSPPPPHLPSPSSIIIICIHPRRVELPFSPRRSLISISTMSIVYDVIIVSG